MEQKKSQKIVITFLYFELLSTLKPVRNSNPNLTETKMAVIY